ncbi:hypothetical protein MKX83_23580 [Cytobacillus sp. FSL M8-0252]|uniref:hypothetical protein n=1 Tax=Cytobacillus sp. FSL M8-0252 TaxID=2921621 RepID=UPI0030F85FF4
MNRREDIIIAWITIEQLSEGDVNKKVGVFKISGVSPDNGAFLSYDRISDRVGIIEFNLAQKFQRGDNCIFPLFRLHSYVRTL